MLNELRFLSIKRRAALLTKRFRIRILPKTLDRIYRRNKVSYRQAKKETRLSDERELQLMHERNQFAIRLKKLIEQGRGQDGLIYMDETTFQLWEKPKKTWMSSDCQVIAQLNNRKLESVTLFGAIGPCLNEPVYMNASATNIQEFKRFIIQMAGQLKNPYSARKPYLVLDNHPAHHSKEVAELLNQYFKPVFQPAYSSPFNCIETVWSILKREWFVRLHRRESDIQSMAEFRGLIEQLCNEVKLSTENLMKSN